MRTRRAITALISTGLAVSVVFAGGSAQAGTHAGARPGAAGIGDQLFPELGNGGYDVAHYGIDFAWQPDQSFRERTVILARATQSLSAFDLDFGGTAVESVRVNGLRAQFTRTNEELVITPRFPLLRGLPFVVDVSTSGSTSDVVFERPFPGPFPFQQTKSGGFALTDQPRFGHFAFPSNDHPADKATYDIAISAPVGWTAVANGTLVNRTTRGTTQTWHYAQRQPMASELVSIAVDTYATTSQTGPHGLPIRNYFPSGMEAKYAPITALAAEEIAWMEQQVGPYPFDRYGIQILDPTRRFGFALENQTLSIYDPGFFNRPQSSWEPVLVHELAHQWFGDSVAPERWSDVWLNEGHATWYEQTFAELKGYGTLIDRMREEYSFGDQDRADFGPVALPNSGALGTLFSVNVYDGGALVLFALREKVGAARFARIERDWARSYRGESASTQDFINLATRIGGPTVRPFLTDWLYGTTTPAMPNHPDWTVTPVTTGASALAVARSATSPAVQLGS
jgi:aminopeptidase N